MNTRLLSVLFIVFGSVYFVVSAEPNVLFGSATESRSDVSEDVDSSHQPTQASGRQATIQLDGLGDAELANLKVAVIGPDGQVSVATVDTKGTARVTIGKNGSYAVVAVADGFHAAELFSFDNDAKQPKIQMTMMRVDRNQLLSINNTLASVANKSLLHVPQSYDASDSLDSPVVLGRNGRLTGRLKVPLTDRQRGMVGLGGTRVSLFQQDRLIATTYCDTRGNFSFDALTPSEFGMIVSGSAGYGAFTIDAVEPDSVAKTSSRGETFVSNVEVDVCCPVVMIPPAYVPEVKATIIEFCTLETTGLAGPVEYPSGAGTSFAGGSFGTSGGFAGGGGGLSGSSLLLPAAIGAAIAIPIAVADDDAPGPPVSEAGN